MSLPKNADAAAYLASVIVRQGDHHLAAWKSDVGDLTTRAEPKAFNGACDLRPRSDRNVEGGAQTRRHQSRQEQANQSGMEIQPEIQESQSRFADHWRRRPPGLARQSQGIALTTSRCIGSDYTA